MSAVSTEHATKSAVQTETSQVYFATQADRGGVIHQILNSTLICAFSQWLSQRIGSKLRNMQFEKVFGCSV